MIYQSYVDSICIFPSESLPRQSSMAAHHISFQPSENQIGFLKFGMAVKLAYILSIPLEFHHFSYLDFDLSYTVRATRKQPSAVRLAKDD